MAICECCGKEYDPSEAEDNFDSEAWLLSYHNIRRSLCGECALEGLETYEEDTYFETCERCGKTFDFIKERSRFDSYFTWYSGTELRDYWEKGILCCDCALEEVPED